MLLIQCALKSPDQGKYLKYLEYMIRNLEKVLEPPKHNKFMKKDEEKSEISNAHFGCPNQKFCQNGHLVASSCNIF
eukprot:UN24333